MKTKQILSVFLGIALVFMLSRCTKDQGSATVNFKAALSKSAATNTTLNLASGNLLLETAIVQIENIAIEDNTGQNDNNNVSDESENSDNNDSDNVQNESENGHNDGDKEDNEGESDKSDGGDLILTGPFSLDISSGFASIGNVTVAPATYRNVNFNFVDGTSAGLGSIDLSGTFTDDAGSATPFKLIYNSSEAFQLPLADSGLVVSTGSTVNLSIVFDVNSWLSGLDFAAAEILNGSIEISATKNSVLYDAFVAALSENIDVED